MNHSSGIGTPYFYEYELGLMECLDMLYDETIDYVSFQDPRFQALDDVVVSKYGKLINIQIKHTSVDENMTFSFFWGKNANEKSLLNSLMNDWKENHLDYPIDEIRIYSNKKYSNQKRDGKISFDSFVNVVLPKLKKDYNYIGDSLEEKNTVNIFKNRLEDCLADDAYEFLTKLTFKSTESLTSIVDAVKSKIKKIIGTDDEDAVSLAFNSLQSKLMYWVTELRDDYRVYKEDVYSALDNENYSYMYFFTPQVPIYPSRIEFANYVKDKLEMNNNILFIQGKPGAGKTNFVSYLSTKQNSIVDFRFYTYYPAEKINNIFSDEYGNYSGKDLWISLLIQLRKYFKDNKLLYKYSFPLLFSYIKDIDLKKVTLKYLSIYRELTGRCNVIIDGLDHAARYNDDWNKTYLSELPSSSELPNGIKLIIVGQPNYDYPVNIMNDSLFLDMPELSIPDIMTMLSNIRFKNISMESVAEIIKNEVGTNTLNVLFSVKEISKLENEFDLNNLVKILKEKKLNNTINNYYEWIYNSFATNPLLKQIAMLMAFSTIKITISDLCQIFSKSLLEIEDAINDLYPLIIKDTIGCFVYHNDVKLFFKNKFIGQRWYTSYAEDLMQKVNSSFKLKHNIMVDLISNSKLDLFDYYNLDYLKESFMYSIPVDFILSEFRKVIVYFLKKERYDKISIINIFMSTIHQIDNIVRYDNNGENSFFEPKLEYLMSEIYNYDVRYEYRTIIDDIFLCLTKNEILRAQYLYDKYFSNYDISLLLELYINNDEYLKKLGYVCRYYKVKISDEIFEGIRYSFIEGWIECSKNYPKEIAVNLSCMKYKAYNRILDDYIKTIMRNDYECVYYNEIKKIITIYNLEYSYYIDLYEKYNCDEDLDYLNIHLKNIIPSRNTFNNEFASFLKTVKFLNPICNDFIKIDNIYKDFCIALNFGKENRAFPIVEKLYNSFKYIYGCLYSNLKYTNKELIKYFDDVFFAANQHGFGSAHDCGYSEASKVIYKMYYELSCKDIEFKEYLSNHYLEINSCVNTFIKWEIFPIYYTFPEKGLQFLKKWYLSDGYLWNYQNSTIEYEGSLIVNELKTMGYIMESNKLETLLLYRKNIGFVDHKDYSLHSLYKWIKIFEENGNEEFLKEMGARILSINDYASSNGDNRFSSTIEKTILKIALNSSPNCFDAIFNMKNNPKNFYYWRTNASEVICNSSNDKYGQLERLIKKWNIHEGHIDDVNLTKWKTLIDKSWEEFLIQIKKFSKDSEFSSKNELLIYLHKYIPYEKKEEFYDSIIKEIFLNRGKYGYEYDWSDKVIDEYYDFIPIKDCYIQLNSIIKETLVFNSFYNIQNDFDLLCRVILKRDNEKYLNEVKKIISMYDTWIGYPDLIQNDLYCYNIDSSVKSFEDVVKKQLCES